LALLEIGKAHVGGRFAHLLKDFFGTAHGKYGINSDIFDQPL
jgi:hypothetical protein